MRKLRIIALWCGIMTALAGTSQSALPRIRVSELLEKKEIRLFDSAYLVHPDQSLFDTIRIDFQLINDTGRDTTIYLYESLSDWVHFKARSMIDSLPDIESVSGRKYYGKVAYDFVYFPGRAVSVKKNGTYDCQLQYTGSAFQPASKNVYLLSPASYVKNLQDQRDFEYVNNIITYLFIGSLAFGFFFFFFLYLKSHYFIFGLYSLFLFIQVLYGVIQFDVYTGFGKFMIYHFNWDDYLNEVLVFTGLAIYVYFMSLWMEVKKSSLGAYYFLNGIAIFFLFYALTIWTIYTIDPHAYLLNPLYKGIRMLSIAIQIAVFYVIIFKVKSPVKGYVLTGTFLVLLFGVGFVAMNQANVFHNTQLEYLDNGSWYMIGILGECMCFASGMGLRYFLIDQSNTRLQQENIRALEEKLTAEQDARENEHKLAEVNQELTNQQLTALRAQMNPHFIFNALNSIQKYIVTGSVDEANSYLSKFSRLQRMILSYCDENFITLDKEIDMLRLYLELEQLRLTHEFHFEIIVDEEIEPEEIMIPPMMLQPFAENAIWHGLIPKQGPKSLRIEFRLSSTDMLTCTVEDNGIGRKAAQLLKGERQKQGSTDKSKGMSLVYNRMALLEKKYGKGFSVTITDKVNDRKESLGTKVEVRIPST